MIRLGVVASAAVLAGAGAVWAGETDCGETRQVWADVKDSRSAAAIQSFAEIYAECSIYSQLARDLLAVLTGGPWRRPRSTPPKNRNDACGSPTCGPGRNPTPTIHHTSPTIRTENMSA